MWMQAVTIKREHSYLQGSQPVAFGTSTHLWYRWPGSNDLGITKQLYATISLPFWRRKWQPTPVCLPGKPRGFRGTSRLQSMGSQSQTRLTDQACMHAPPFKFFFIFIEFLMDTFHVQFFQNIHCVLQCTLEPILYPRVCTPHSSTPILPLPTPGNHLFVLYFCKFTSFMLHSLV